MISSVRWRLWVRSRRPPRWRNPIHRGRSRWWCHSRRVEHSTRRPYCGGADGGTFGPVGDRGEHDRRGGIIGVNRVISAKPDGYTVLLGTVGTHAYNQTIYKKRRYDAINDFTPVALFSDQPMVLEARKDLPANTLHRIRRAAEAERCENAIRLRRRGLDHASRPARCSTPGSASMSRTSHTGARRRPRTI